MDGHHYRPGAQRALDGRERLYGALLVFAIRGLLLAVRLVRHKFMGSLACTSKVAPQAYGGCRGWRLSAIGVEYRRAKSRLARRHDSLYPYAANQSGRGGNSQQSRIFILRRSTIRSRASGLATGAGPEARQRCDHECPWNRVYPGRPLCGR